ncbi:MAG: DUF4863 family protein [Sandaracinaceae bacterium]|nr:DUF4863 family protein [Sandaracinaceae bacterium]
MTEPLERLDAALGPVLEVVRTIDPADPGARAALEARLPLGSPQIARLAAVVREGVAAGWLASREAGGVRFGRVRKAADDADLSIDCVHMDRPGPGHTHPNGEIDLSFAVDGAPTFDGRPPGWTVYPPGSWHVPTVEGGVMDILYFLPGGAIRFEPKP